MTSGGARMRSGPAPDPLALRRDKDKADWIHLPAAGRQGDPPPWPLARPAKRELQLWAEEWKRPQAIMWEANGQQNEVALYVRSFRDAEQADAGTALRTLVRQQMDSLGISLPGLRGCHWIIDPPDAQPSRKAPGTDGTAKSRWKVLDGGS